MWTGVIAAGAAAAWIASTVAPAAIDAFMTRFDQAGRAEDSTLRLAQQTFGFLWEPTLSWFGVGIGASSQTGISLGSGQTWVEVDSFRWVVEIGVLGFVFAVVRLGIAIVLAAIVVFGARRRGWTEIAVIAAMLPVLAFGAITQTPSAQGAIGVMVVLLLASRDERTGAGIRLDVEREDRSPRTITPGREDAGQQTKTIGQR